MTHRPQPLNAPASVAESALYPEPAFGNPVSTLFESGVGNCFPGLEFDVRQLDARFFPGLVFAFPGVTPAGPDGTQGAVLAFVDTSGDPMLAGDAAWVTKLNAAYSGDAGAALGDGTWYLHWVEQDGKRIELYDFGIYQNTVTATPYEGETCWWIIRLIEPGKPLTIALTQRDSGGSPMGNPVVLHGERRRFLGDDGVFDASYRPGELTSSMCSPWTHDFRDCACQYWASNHPDVALGPIETGFAIPGGTSEDDAAQAVTFLDWMRRRDAPSRDVSAATTIDGARPRRYDPYEINLRWQELSFVLNGMEVEGGPHASMLEPPGEPYPSDAAMIEDLTDNLAPLELTLAMEYLYAYFSLRSPEEVSPDEAARWPGLADDLRAARQLILSVALSEMTHARWVNQVLWTLWRAGAYPDGESYEPVVTASRTVPAPPPGSGYAADLPVESDGEGGYRRPRALRPATPATLREFEFVERPGQDVDTEYSRLVRHLHDQDGALAPGLYEIAVRIDSDGMQHYQKFRDVLRILSAYQAKEPREGSPEPIEVYLRPIQMGTPDNCKRAVELTWKTMSLLREAYAAESLDDMPLARKRIIEARAMMHDLRDECERLAGRKHLGVPFFAAFDRHA